MAIGRDDVLKRCFEAMFGVEIRVEILTVVGESFCTKFCPLTNEANDLGHGYRTYRWDTAIRCRVRFTGTVHGNGTSRHGKEQKRVIHGDFDTSNTT
ncbi:hypothetical protein Poly51_22450 [Rubripirellula tenax]|uniref:Uncharacterized protein n=1 Tax=Rubripirellula tenax TaxID=2528015 RepID=A0A5C6FFD8_9BACT|nr:hypothetical protein Poly51_22450 [Rubripirellula tenax]